MPSSREQIDHVLRVASLTTRPSERVALLQTALLLLDEAATIGAPDLVVLRWIAETRIQEEQAIDAKYTQLAHRLMNDARRGAAQARIGNVQRVLTRIPREDARLGGWRPEIVRALRASVQSQLVAARRLRSRTRSVRCSRGCVVGPSSWLGADPRATSAPCTTCWWASGALRRVL